MEIKISQTSSPHSQRYLNVGIEEQQEAVPVTNIYQNLGAQISTPVIYTEVMKKEQPIISDHAFVSPNNNEDESTKISVRDLVKRFNRQ